MSILLLQTLQGFLFVVGAPLVIGVLRHLRARGQLRTGPPILQAYYDIVKLFRKGTALPEEASWAFRSAPYVVFSCYAVAGLGLPLFASPLLDLDLVTLSYLIGLAAFFTAIAGLDLGTAFGNIGSSRLLFLRTMVEPVFFLVIAGLALKWQTTSLARIVQGHQLAPGSYFDPANLMLFAAVCLITLIETHRLPIDNLETNLELTMSYKGTLIEYSGHYLALFEWSESLKLLLMSSLAVKLFFPIDLPMLSNLEWNPLPLILYLMKLSLFILGLTAWELSQIRVRMFQVVEYTLVSSFLALIAIVYIIVTMYFMKG